MKRNLRMESSSTIVGDTDANDPSNHPNHPALPTAVSHLGIGAEETAINIGHGAGSNQYSNMNSTNSLPYCHSHTSNDAISNTNTTLDPNAATHTSTSQTDSSPIPVFLEPRNHTTSTSKNMSASVSVMPVSFSQVRVLNRVVAALQPTHLAKNDGSEH